MLQMIYEYDYTHFAKNVEALRTLLDAENVAEADKVVIDFLVAAQETVEKKLKTLSATTEYMIWCLSDDAQEIVIFAKSLSINNRSKCDTVSELIHKCAEELVYLISIKCAQFYTED